MLLLAHRPCIGITTTLYCSNTGRDLLTGAKFCCPNHTLTLARTLVLRHAGPSTEAPKPRAI